jgi:hypothetical protein
MMHNQIVEVVSESRMITELVVMVSHQMYCIDIKWDVIHAWLARQGIPNGKKNMKFHVE